MVKFLKKYWFILTLTLVGAFLRLYRIEATLQFLGDQGRDALILRRMLVDHDLPFIGPVTSVGGFYLGPLYYYLMAPFLWLANYNPVGPAIATAVIGIITIPALYLITKEFFSKKTANITTLLYAIAAIPVTETRGAWNPNPMPLAVLGLVYGFYQFQKTKKLSWLILSAISFGAALQFHYMIVFLGPFILWQLILILRNKSRRRYLLVWLGTLLVMMLPLILFEIKNNFLNFNGLIEYLTKNDYQTLNLWQIFKNLRGRSEEAIGMILGFGRRTTFIRTWITRGILIGILWFWFKKPSRQFKLVSLWLLLSIASIAFYQANIPPYYLAFLFPAVFMLTGFILSHLEGKLLLISLAFLGLFLSFNYRILNKALTSTGNLKSVQKTAQFIKDDIDKNNHQNYNLSLLDDTRDYKAQSFRYYLEVFGAKPLGLGDYPQTKILYVISPYKQNPQEILSHPIWEIRSLGPAELISIWEFEGSENIYKIKKL